MKNRPGVKYGDRQTSEKLTLFRNLGKIPISETEPRRAKRSKIWDHAAINLH